MRVPRRAAPVEGAVHEEVGVAPVDRREPHSCLRSSSARRVFSALRVTACSAASRRPSGSLMTANRWSDAARLRLEQPDQLVAAAVDAARRSPRAGDGADQPAPERRGRSAAARRRAARVGRARASPPCARACRRLAARVCCRGAALASLAMPPRRCAMATSAAASRPTLRRQRGDVGIGGQPPRRAAAARRAAWRWSGPRLAIGHSARAAPAAGAPARRPGPAPASPRAGWSAAP